LFFFLLQDKRTRHAYMPSHEIFNIATNRKTLYVVNHIIRRDVSVLYNTRGVRAFKPGILINADLMCFWFFDRKYIYRRRCADHSRNRTFRIIQVRFRGMKFSADPGATAMRPLISRALWSTFIMLYARVYHRKQLRMCDFACRSEQLCHTRCLCAR